VRVAGVVSRPQLERSDAEGLDLLDHFIEAEFGEQSGEQTYLHDASPFKTAGGWRRSRGVRRRCGAPRAAGIESESLAKKG